MPDPTAGCDTYDVLSGIGEPSLCQRMKAWGRMDDIDAAQVDWEEKARKLLVDGSYEIERLNKIIEAKNG
jgi:hypothetical protein